MPPSKLCLLLARFEPSYYQSGYVTYLPPYLGVFSKLSGARWKSFELSAAALCQFTLRFKKFTDFSHYRVSLGSKYEAAVSTVQRRFCIEDREEGMKGAFRRGS